MGSASTEWFQLAQGAGMASRFSAAWLLVAVAAFVHSAMWTHSCRGADPDTKPPEAKTLIGKNPAGDVVTFVDGTIWKNVTVEQFRAKHGAPGKEREKDK